MRAPGTDPARLDLQRLADRDSALQGRWPGADLVRLAQDALGEPGEVVWSARAERRPVPGGAPALWLHLHCECRLTLTCQRCLQPFEVTLAPDRSIRFARDEAEAERLDEESEEDVLALPSAGLDLLALVEDELILALPIVPRHEVCPQPLEVPTSDAPAPDRPNPFEALAALKRRSS